MVNLMLSILRQEEIEKAKAMGKIIRVVKIILMIIDSSNSKQPQISNQQLRNLTIKNSKLQLFIAQLM
jgi:hypothetical protein